MGKRKKAPADQAASATTNRGAKRATASQPPEPNLIYWWPSKADVTLPVGQAVYLTGHARVLVKTGSLWAFGKRIVPGDSAVAVCAEARAGAALALQACPETVQIPTLTQQACQLEVHRWHGDANVSACSEGQQAGREGLGFQLHRSADAGAPELLPLHDQWCHAASSIAETSLLSGAPLRIVVCGSKGVGKSTCARLLVNTLLNCYPRVAYLDTDCGQAEFTVPGMLSLCLLDTPIFGPPHLHMRQPAYAHFFGDTSPQSNPELYVAAVRSLYAWYTFNLGVADMPGEPACWPPLVVNTHGWIKGVEAASALGCSDTSAGPGSARGLTAVEARALQWLAFAMGCLGRPPAQGRWDLDAFAAAALGLAACCPFVVAWQDVHIEGLHASCAEPVLPHAVNGVVVGLAKGQAAALEGGKAVLECVGAAVVRTVDAAKGLLYLLTSVPEAVLQQVTTLQVGRMELPSSLLQTGAIMSPYLTSWSISTEGTGAALNRGRNLARLGQAAAGVGRS
ncbi:hypothetical protein WJX72_007830 [[Myrmecia] bisecta]|uniref:Uncharacterized protein n=1 Tax=[Myrmecia] bisecta TaxID=41462 RepID=A0AAW1PTG4_9CHLO